MKLFPDILVEYKLVDYTLVEKIEDIEKVDDVDNIDDVEDIEDLEDIENVDDIRDVGELKNVDDEQQMEQDGNRQGLIRAVANAHLVYKRKNPSGLYDELWIYNISNINDQITTRQAILAGTDIEHNNSSSEDDQQHYTLWTAGNAEMMLITGLPN